MIPKKLYIPTSTLNFNNIMSSESISPVAFYVHRRFGYKRFYKVVPNNFDNLILLYDKYPVFDINDKELENYPLVIEIDTQTISDDYIQEKDSVFFTNRTLYLNPYSTRIIFRTEPERTTSLSKSEPSIESKLIPLYKGQFIVLSNEIETFNWTPINLDDLPEYDNNAVSFDIATNKLKGMLYGYLLGANISSSNEVVSLKRKVKELRNVLSAILASPDGHATHFQDRQLNDIYNSINQSLYALSGVHSRVNEIIAQKIEHYNAPAFVDILKGEGFYNEWFNKQVSQLNIRHYQITPFCLPSQSTDKVAELDKYIDYIENLIRVYDIKSKLDVSKLPIVQNHRIVEIPDQKEFLSVLFNEYRNEAWNGSEFLSSRYDFAKFGGKLFRESLGDKWENSTARTYVNSLLKNLNEYAEFDINSTDSDILKSFAAFCQKGESDIDKLSDYLISNGIGDFRIAFALWGLVFGYAEMPKTLTNELFESLDDKYITECYKYIHKQLHSIELEGSLDRTPKKEQKPMGIWEGVLKKGKKVIESVTGKSEDQTRKPESPAAKQNQLEHRDVPEELAPMFNSEAFKKLSLQAQQYFITESLKLYAGRIDKAYIEALKKLEYPKSKTNWQNAIKVLNQKQRKAISKMNTDTLSLFPVASTGLFLTDFDFLTNSTEFRNLVSAVRGWKNDLKWFIDAHNPNHEDYKYYQGKSTDNESVIKQFIFLKKEKYKNTEGFLRRTYLEQ